MSLTIGEQRDVKELVAYLEALCQFDDLPNNQRRALTASNIQRLMPYHMKDTVNRVKFFVDVLGYEFKTRFTVIEACKAIGITVNFVPTEQDCCGWVTAKFITPKGSFHYG